MLSRKPRESLVLRDASSKQIIAVVSIASCVKSVASVGVTADNSVSILRCELLSEEEQLEVSRFCGKKLRIVRKSAPEGKDKP